jgi:hypothetical protein
LVSLATVAGLLLVSILVSIVTAWGEDDSSTDKPPRKTHDQAD